MSDFYRNDPRGYAPFGDEEPPNGGANRWRQPESFAADRAPGPMDEDFSAQRRPEQASQHSFLMEEPAPYGAEMQQGGVPLFDVESPLFEAHGVAPMQMHASIAPQQMGNHRKVVDRWERPEAAAQPSRGEFEMGSCPIETSPRGQHRRVGRVARYQEEAPPRHPTGSVIGLPPPRPSASPETSVITRNQIEAPPQGQQRRAGRVTRYQEEAALGVPAESAVGLASPVSFDPFPARAGEVESPFSGDQGDAPTRIGMPVISQQMVNRQKAVGRLGHSGPAPQLFREVPDITDNQLQTLPQGRPRRTDRVACSQAVAAPAQLAQSTVGFVPAQTSPAQPHPAQAVPVQVREAVAVATAVPQPSAMNTAPPYQSQLRGAAVYATPQATFADQGGIAEDWDDDGFGDSGVIGVIRQVPQPVPVPAVPAYEEDEKGHSGFVTFLLTLTMLISLAIIYFTGVADGVLAMVGIPAWEELTVDADENSGAPWVFSRQATASEDGAAQGDEADAIVSTPELAPASASGAPRLLSMSVEPAMSKAPATLVFTLESNSAVINVQLRNEHLELLAPSEVSGSPSGDGILWKCVIEVEQPYQGLVEAYVSDGSGNWQKGGFSCEVSVQ